jgi:translation initiation factor IF-2
MSDAGEERTPKTQTAFSGRPPRPPQMTARGLEDQPGEPGKTVYLLDPMRVGDLAIALQLKPFKVVADLIEMKIFKLLDDRVDFETAARIAQKHGYRPERPPPGMLVL